MQFDRGYISPSTSSPTPTWPSSTSPSSSSMRRNSPRCNRCFRFSKPWSRTSAFVIIAEEVEGEALATLVVNKLRGGLKATVKAPGFGDRRKAMLEDIAIATGGQVISEDLGIKLENVKLASLGTAKKIRITKDDTTIIDGAGKKSEIQARVGQIKQQQIEETTSTTKEKLQERPRSSRAALVIRVGGRDGSRSERRRIASMTRSTPRRRRSAKHPPGRRRGTSLCHQRFRASLATTKTRMRASRPCGAIQSPLRQIVCNSGRGSLDWPQGRSRSRTPSASTRRTKSMSISSMPASSTRRRSCARRCRMRRAWFF